MSPAPNVRSVRSRSRAPGAVEHLATRHEAIDDAAARDIRRRFRIPSRRLPVRAVAPILAARSPPNRHVPTSRARRAVDATPRFRPPPGRLPAVSSLRGGLRSSLITNTPHRRRKVVDDAYRDRGCGGSGLSASVSDTSGAPELGWSSRSSCDVRRGRSDARSGATLESHPIRDADWRVGGCEWAAGWGTLHRKRRLRCSISSQLVGALC